EGQRRRRILHCRRTEYHRLTILHQTRAMCLPCHPTSLQYQLPASEHPFDSTHRLFPSVSSPSAPSPTPSIPQPQILDQTPILLHVRTLQIVQEPPPAANQHEEAAPPMMVLLVRTEVLGQMIDPCGEQRDLY